MNAITWQFIHDVKNIAIIYLVLVVLGKKAEFSFLFSLELIYFSLTIVGDVLMGASQRRIGF